MDFVIKKSVEILVMKKNVIKISVIIFIIVIEIYNKFGYKLR